MIYIFWTASNHQEAKTISRYIIENKWAACASIIPQVLSIYYWDGKVQEDEEVKVIFKTKKSFFDTIREYIDQESSYDVSEITMLKIDDVCPKYLKWLEDYVS